jgi:hypothetical protein
MNINMDDYTNPLSEEGFAEILSRLEPTPLSGTIKLGKLEIQIYPDGVITYTYLRNGSILRSDPITRKKFNRLLRFFSRFNYE